MMNYPLSFFLKTTAFLLQGIVIFCGFYFKLNYCFTISYLLSALFGVASIVLPLLVPEKLKPNTLQIQRQNHHSILSFSLVAGCALLFFTGFGRLFFEETYHIEIITVFFSVVLITQAFEKPVDTVLRWEPDGLLIMGEKVSNTLAYGSITHFEVDDESITIYTVDGIIHHIENIVWKENEQELAQAFLEESEKK